MLSAEPRSDTIARRTRMQGDYPALQFSSPTEIAQVDASAPDTTPTNFTRDSLKYGLMALDTIDYPDFTRDKSWLTASQQPDTPDTGPMGMMGPQGISAPMQGPYAPPSPLEQGGGAFDPYAYDQPFRPGGESDPYGQTSQPGVGQRLAGSFGINTDTLGQDILDYPSTIPGKVAATRLNPGGFDALANLSQDLNPGTAIARTLRDPLQIPKDVMGVKPLLTGSTEAELLSNPWNALPVGRAASVAGKIGENTLGTIGAQALAEGAKEYGTYRGKPLSEAPEWIQQAVSFGVSVPGYIAGQKLAQGLGKAGESLAGVTAGRIPGMMGIETNPMAEVEALKAKIAAEGMTPENAAAQDALLTKLSEAFKNDVPSWEQPPPPVPNGSEGQRIGQAITSARQGEIVTDALANARQTPAEALSEAVAARTEAESAYIASRTPANRAAGEAARSRVADLEKQIRAAKRAGTDYGDPLLAKRTPAMPNVESGAAALPDAPVEGPMARAARERAESQRLDDAFIDNPGGRTPIADKPTRTPEGEPWDPSLYRARQANSAAERAAGAEGGTTLQARFIPFGSASSQVGALGGGVAGAQVGDTPEERVRNSLIGAAGGAVVGPLVNRGISGIAKGIEARRGPMVNADGSVRTATQNINEILASPLSALSTYDLSAPGRQLFRSMLAHPTTIPRVFRAQMSALRSEEAFKASQEALAARPWAAMRDLMGVEMGEVGENIAKREEMIQSTITERLLPKSKAFNRAYTGAINEQRDFLTKYMLDRIPKELLGDVSDGSEGLARLRQAGRLINAATGRGNLGEAAKDSKVFGQPLFWAIRNRVGNAQVPLSAIFSTSPEVRIEAARQTAALIGLQMALFGVGKATGAWDVETDPRSSDFGMVRVGNRRLDFTAGTRPLVNLIARTGISASNTLYGTKIPNDKTIWKPDGTGGKTYPRPWIEVAGNYIRGALQPTLGEVWNQAEGKDIVGNKLPDSGIGRVAHAAQGLGVALFLQQLAEEMAYTVPKGYQEGGAKGAAIAGAGSLGAAGVFYGQGVGGSYYQPKAATGGGAARPSRPSRPSRPVRPTR